MSLSVWSVKYGERVVRKSDVFHDYGQYGLPDGDLEGFGMVFLEASAAGLAVVGSRGGLAGLGLLAGLGHLLVWPALYATFYDEVPDRSMVSATLSAALAAAGFLAELGLGRLSAGPAYAATYWGAAACALAASLLVLPLRRALDRGRWRES